MRNQAVSKFQEHLHISYSQIFTYLACSLKYRFQYFEQRPHEHIPINLSFGSAIHTAIERYYRSMKEKNALLSLEGIQEVFQEQLETDLDNRTLPILFKKETPDRKSAIELGKGLLKAFYEGIDMTGFSVVDIELPLTATLFTDEGIATDLTVAGIIDLVLKDAQGNILAVDNKTAKQPYSQAMVDSDLQLTSYAYLLAANRYMPPRADVHCRFDVMRKLKTPSFEQYFAVRTAFHRRRFAKLTNAILEGIEARIFFPNRSWLCADCAFSKTCEAW